jgi:hypothetical protein
MTESSSSSSSSSSRTANTIEMPDLYRLMGQMAEASLRASREAADHDISEALYAACERGDVVEAARCLKLGANRDYLLPFWNHSVLHRAVFKGHADVVELLLEAGADVASRSADLSTPLHLACSDGHVRLVELLLGHGAPTTAKTIRDETPLDLASTEATRNVILLWDVRFAPTKQFFRQLPPGSRQRLRLVLLIHAHLRHSVGRTDSTDDHGAWLRDVTFGDVPHWIVWDILALVWTAEQRLHKFGWQPSAYK